MRTTSEASEQAPFVTVHVNVAELPIVNPVTPDVALEGVVNNPVPDAFVQVPVPVADNEAVVTLHNAWSTPALDVTGEEELIVTLALVLQAPFVTVHKKMEASPTIRPETPDDKLEGVVTTPKPEVVVQLPVPGEGLLPDNVVEVTLHKFCIEPALAVTGVLTVVPAVAEVTHVPLVIVHVYVNDVPEVTVEVVDAFVELTKLAAPPDTVHTPVPGLGADPVKVTVGEVVQIALVALAVAVTGDLTAVVPFAEVTHAPLVIVQV